MSFRFLDTNCSVDLDDRVEERTTRIQWDVFVTRMRVLSTRPVVTEKYPHHEGVVLAACKRDALVVARGRFGHTGTFVRSKASVHLSKAHDRASIEEVLVLGVEDVQVGRQVSHDSLAPIHHPVGSNHR